jgi:hypothetical protein
LHGHLEFPFGQTKLLLVVSRRLIPGRERRRFVPPLRFFVD